MKLVIHPAIDESRLQAIREVSSALTVVNCTNAENALAEITDADAFFGKMTPALLRAAGKLRWVQSPTASLEHYLFPELTEHPCQLSNMRGLYSDVIADHVMGYILMIARRFHLYLRQQMRHQWAPVGGESARQPFSAGPGYISEIDRNHLHLSDCTLGIIGVGSIGSEIARRASAFGMKIIGIDPVTRRVPGVIEDVWRPDRLSDLLQASDFVCIAAPHTPETEKLIRRPQLEQMRPHAWLINIGRGAIIDLANLTQSLKDGVIAGAALDVFEIEPLPEAHPLWDMENVIITPHVAAASPRIAERHLETLLENVRRFVDGQPPATLVDKRRWY